MLMLLLCEEYEASNGSACTTAADEDDENSPTPADDVNDLYDQILMQEFNKAEFDEALQKNAEVWPCHF